MCAGDAQRGHTICVVAGVEGLSVRVALVHVGPITVLVGMVAPFGCVCVLNPKPSRRPPQEPPARF